MSPAANSLVYALTGEVTDEAVERAKLDMARRRERGAHALRRIAAGEAPDVVGARELGGHDVVVEGDAQYFAAWREKANIKYTLEDELRPGSNRHVDSIKKDKPRERGLRNLAVHVCERDEQPPLLAMHAALGLRALRCEPRAEVAAPQRLGPRATRNTAPPPLPDRPCATRLSAPPPLATGMRVEARFGATERALKGQLTAVACTKWYPGVLREEVDDGLWHVDYDDGDEEAEVVAKYIRVQSM